MRPHAGHWATIPIIEFRVLYRIFGLRSYVPYQFVLVLCHLAVAVLLRIVMRRAGVGPWVATCAAAVIVLFGPGAQNIVWAFQVTFVGALLFGLTQLILIDHDGGLERRDWLALLAGVAALLCSGVGVAMVGIVGLATLLRRGWRMAAFQTVPLGAMFGLWYLVEKPERGQPVRPPVGGSVDRLGELGRGGHVPGHRALLVRRARPGRAAGRGPGPGLGPAELVRVPQAGRSAAVPA